MEEQPLPVLLARQGIYDKQGLVHAYELFYRNKDPSTFSCSGEEATSSVITQLFSTLDINTIVGDKRAYINFTYHHLVEKIPALLPKERIGIEVLETVVVDKLLLQSLSWLKDQGYQIILDDFILTKQTAPLVELADVIKIDILNQNKHQISQQLIGLHAFKGKLLAEKIEAKEQYLWCLELGFDYFQGFFLNKPDPLKSQLISENKRNMLKLFSELNNENVAINHIEEFILQIPRLSYRILRLANSAAAYQGKKIDSLIDAIQKLGLEQIRNWVSLFLLSSEDDLVPDLLERTFIRAKMCESLARLSGYPDPHQAYTVGMLSTLDQFFHEPMASLLSKIQLSEALNEALLYQQGELGTILRVTINYEKAQFNHMDESTYQWADLIRSYLSGIEYANSIMAVMSK